MISAKRKRGTQIAIAVVVIVVLLYSLGDLFEDAGVSYVRRAFPKRNTRFKVAVAFFGVRLDHLATNYSRAKRFVTDPLNADVFVYGHDNGNNEAGMMQKLFGKKLVSAFVGPQMNRREVLSLFQQVPDYETWLEWYKEENAVGPGSLLNYYWVEMAYYQVQTYEKLHNFSYDFILFLRPDVEWLFEHPPLEHFDMDKIYFPSNRGWGGFQHTAVLCKRKLAAAFAMKWSAILNGTLISRFKDNHLRCDYGSNCNAETMTMMTLPMLGSEGTLYTAVSALGCAKSLCTGADFCWSGKSLCSKGQRFKYPIDGKDAIDNVKRIKQQGWQLHDFHYY